MKTTVAALFALLVPGCVTPSAPGPSPIAIAPEEPTRSVDPREAVRSTLRAFVTAVEAKDFAAAHALLSQDWRTRYDVARLERDYGLEPLAADRVRRLKAHLEGPLDLSGPAVTLALGDGASARLVLEPGGWKLSALE